MRRREGSNRRVTTLQAAGPPGSAEPTDGAIANPARLGWVWCSLAGIAALALGLGIAELSAVLVSPRATPVVAAGDTAIELAPRWGKDFAIAVFGVRDKLFLVTVVAVVAVLLAAAAGILEARRRRTGLILIALVSISLALAAASRPGADTFAYVPGLLAGVSAMVVLPILLRRLGAAGLAAAGSGVAGSGAGGTSGRRAVLLGGVLAAAGVTGFGGYALGARVRGVASSRADVALPAPATPVAPVSGSATFDQVPDLAPFQTPVNDFYRIDTALVVPAVRADEWRLRIHGLVEREAEYRIGDILDRELVEKWVTLACVSNEVGGGLTGNALWLGLPTAQLLAEARPRPEADMVLSTSIDGFTAGTPIEALTDGRGALLAVGMNGSPLPVEHGFPARLVVPGLYGYVSATKWVVDLEVTRFADAEAYWTVRGWTALGPIKISSRIDRPIGGTQPGTDGTVVVAGMAWAQDVGVEAVEVRVDSGDGWGPWTTTELADAGTTSTWRQWRWSWVSPPAGEHRIQARATDANGDVQVEAEAEPFPSGATGYHTVGVSIS